MQEKVKITKAEIKDIYDITDDTVETTTKEQTDKDSPNASVTFEEYTEIKDKEDDKKWRTEEEED